MLRFLLLLSAVVWWQVVRSQASAEPEPKDLTSKQLGQEKAVSTCEFLHRKGLLLAEEGSFTAALEKHNQALTTATKEFGPEHWCARDAVERTRVSLILSEMKYEDRLVALQMLSKWKEGRKLMQKAAFPEALPLIQDAQQHCRRLGLEQSYLSAFMDKHSTDCIEHTFKFAECVQAYRKQLAILEACFGTAHPD